ncbi:DNA-3-methyladenine glycosylase [Peribacillus loiseleuriae]|uniref:Putative 3-methyladenine DNA glycosylase n=1 Tax=Peribacillus loiseleuriae TaxID=1679170 RepID=A0A0K9GQH9_9BACI|nr:DNA-3-methyladenine glycosylase [Peribacillus loiseleuriae]KMY48903.1 3-methyladenine DNA glycosylase [Peribacillus loiseleuriae]
MTNFHTPLSIDFFEKPTLNLAQSLLGCLLVKETPESICSGYIVETEAYMGPEDRAAHSFGNRRTKRTEIMFGRSGLVYTYQMHTHTLVNVTSGGVDKPEAILIRAVEPVEGIERMQQRRSLQDVKKLTNGPGKLTKALGITMQDYGSSYTKPPIYITSGIIPEHISIGPRIGIGNSGEAKDYPWRFWITGNSYVSK